MTAALTQQTLAQPGTAVSEGAAVKDLASGYHALHVPLHPRVSPSEASGRGLLQVPLMRPLYGEAGETLRIFLPTLTQCPGLPTPSPPFSLSLYKSQGPQCSLQLNNPTSVLLPFALNGTLFHGGKWAGKVSPFFGSGFLFIPLLNVIKGLTLSLLSCCFPQMLPYLTVQLSFQLSWAPDNDSIRNAVSKTKLLLLPRSSNQTEVLCSTSPAISKPDTWDLRWHLPPLVGSP